LRTKWGKAIGGNHWVHGIKKIPEEINGQEYWEKNLKPCSMGCKRTGNYVGKCQIYIHIYNS
jgi:hypothetical protein